MGRQLFLVSAVTALLLISLEVSQAQGPPRRSSPSFRPSGNQHNSHPQFQPGRDRLYQLSPEERQAFRRNAERWLQMKPEQQKILRERENVRRQQLKIEAEAALRQLGLRLDGTARDQFEARYFQERRRIERELRQEVETKRQQQLPQLNERLKSEFQPHQGGVSATPGPSASGKNHN